MVSLAHETDAKAGKRIRLNSIIYILLWCCGITLIFVGAPFWSVLLVGVVGGYFALRDWRTVRSLAREAIAPRHPDADVQALIDGDIEISEYRKRKENGDAV
ncbi:hypothetical protein KIK84_15385 [Curvibacter sp. CHRR-16]|uniref:hypothetical protein n=1 Tax=Curvibacter sp. CHRR-16 TaxID=2835872 RepID=UPI001BD942C3|nr:hypothetical protein [Curvibacter sp. CHRR-16]MBT0571708.1 hypothetical protein [Curvibacter sp. CHRR-16]